MDDSRERLPLGARLKMYGRRFARHLGRSKALAAFALSAASLLVFLVVQGDGATAETVREFALIVASLALGTAFLPELSSNLWDLDADEVRSLVPEDKVRDIQDAIVRARVEEGEWADAVVGSAVHPLIDAGRKPHKVVADFSYVTQVHLDSPVEVDGCVRPIRRVETSLRARRRLPALSGQSHEYWIAIARNHKALQHEYKRDECLFREVVELDDNLDDDTWRQVVTGASTARIVVDGHPVDGELAADPADDPDRVVRWYFDAAELAPAVARRCGVAIYVDHPLGSTWDRFLVSLSSYYVMGSAQLRFQLYDAEDRYELFHEPFLAAALGTSTDVEVQVKPGLCKELTVVTGDASLLWPGTGLAVWWRRRGLDGGSEPSS